MIPLVGPAFYVAGAATAGPSTTKWDSAKKGPNIVLSNEDLTAALYSNAESFQPENCQMVLANNAIPAAGRFYWEVELVSSVDAAAREYGAMVGISTTVVNYDADYRAYYCRVGSLPKGYGASGYGYVNRNAGSAQPWNTSSQPGFGGAVAIGTRQGVLFDAGTRLLRFSFNGVIDTALSVTAVAATYYPAVSPGSLDDNVLTVRGHFSAADWLFAPPAGYGQLP